MKLPFLKFWVTDWMADEGLRLVSLPARGLWIEMLCMMAKSPEHGRLLTIAGKPMGYDQVGKLCGSSEVEVKPLIEELGDAGVFSIDRAGVIFSRRMVRDEKDRKLNRDRVSRWRNADVMPDVMEKKCSSNGAEARGQKLEARVYNKEPANSKPTLDEWIAYSKEIKWEKANAESAFDYYESNGWKIGGKSPVKDWKACARNCQRRSFDAKIAQKVVKKEVVPQNYSPPLYRIAGYSSYADWKDAGSPIPE